MQNEAGPVFLADCPTRLAVEIIADKWAVLVLFGLSPVRHDLSILDPERRDDGLLPGAVRLVLHHDHLRAADSCITTSRYSRNRTNASAVPDRCRWIATRPSRLDGPDNPACLSCTGRDW